MKLLRWTLLGLLVALLLIPSAVVYYVATTEAGLKFVARHLGHLGPVTITAGEVTGTLTKGFQVSSLRVQHRRTDIEIEGAAGRLELWPLLVAQQINLPTLTVDRVAITVLHDPTPHPQTAPRFLPALFRVDVAALRVGDAALTTASGHVLAATDIVAAATIYPKQIRVRSAQLEYGHAHLTATGRVHAAWPLGLQGEVNAAYRPEGLPAWQVAARFKGDLDQLPLAVDIDAPFHAAITGTAWRLTSNWKLTAAATVRDFDLQPFGGGNALGVISGQLNVAADKEGFAAKGGLLSPGLHAGAMAVDFDADYANKRLNIHHASVAHAASGARATIRGSVEVVPGGPQLNVRGDWTKFRWPLNSKDAAFASPSGSYSLTGLKPWQIDARGTVITPGTPAIPAVPATLRGTLATDALLISSATARAFGGTATIGGEVRWHPAQSWRISGRVVDLDPAAIRADLPGNLNFNLAANGAPFGSGAALALEFRQLSGRLRGQAASGKGKISLAAGSTDWQFHEVDMRLGHTHLQLEGGLGQQRDLRFSLEADDLSLLDANAKGRISARGRYAGTDAAPLLQFKAHGSDFEWNGASIAALNADIDIDASTGGHAQGHFDLDQLQIAGRTARKATIELSGNNAAQRFALNVATESLSVGLSAHGVVQQGLWQGAIESLSIEDERDLKLTLESPAPLQLSPKQFSVNGLCLKGNDERACATAQRTADGVWNTTFSATSLPLRTLTAGLTQSVDYDGTINLAGEATGSSTSPVTGKVRADLQQARLRHELSNGRKEDFSLGTGSVVLLATATELSAQVGLDAGSSGNFHGDLTAQRTSADWHDHPVKGSLNATTDELGILDVYIGGIDKATGRLTTRLTVGGTLGQPELAGMLQLRNTQIDVYAVNLSLRNLSLDATFNNEALDLSGESRLGNGTAKFSGKLAWRDREPYGDLHMEGENLRVTDVPEARIDASPNLDFKLTGRRIDVTGEVRVPYAKLEPADLTNAVLSSSDERLVGAPLVDPAKKWLVVSNIRLLLGEQVNITALGLNARLGGDLTVRTDESQISRGTGELNIAEGRYTAFGRLLDIERGRLLFNNVPVADPGIDLRAQKVYPDVTAGVIVRGSLRAPRPTFFSEPAIPQSQIVSLLLAGGSLESVQSSSRPGAARNDLLTQGSAILAQRFGSHVGIDDVSIESDLSNESSLVLGRYLSPRLYISYGISLAEAINTLKLRYTIGDHWTIKTEAGKARSADIVYSIHKK